MPKRRQYLFILLSGDSHFYLQTSSKKSPLDYRDLLTFLYFSGIIADENVYEVKEAEEFEKELRETERKAVEEAKSFMRPIQLNIDKSARSKEESDRSKEKEMILIKKLCGEVREIAKASNPEEREERRQEMEKVRSARLRCQ